ncbi:MAG: hypothetical protein M3063_03760, partial [Actinomycetota bacterium]|nr:hypothetical protein [Actinomycetota bacterium]
EVRRLVDEAYSRACTVLAASRPALDLAVVALLEHETLTGADLGALTETPLSPDSVRELL